LEGVEAREAPALAVALRRAVDATNHALMDESSPTANANMAQEEANAIAAEIARESRPEPPLGGLGSLTSC
jgi:hypothetical protein